MANTDDCKRCDIECRLRTLNHNIQHYNQLIERSRSMEKQSHSYEAEQTNKATTRDLERDKSHLRADGESFVRDWHRAPPHRGGCGDNNKPPVVITQFR